jgi:saccharopine dehydrogenase-like NADP-dependent oxidoreductase
VPSSSQTVSVHLVSAAASDGRTVTVRAVSRPHFGLGGSIVSTAAPAAAAVRMLARGGLRATGVLAPEQCIDPDEMFAELEGRSCSFAVNAAG